MISAGEIKDTRTGIDSHLQTPSNPYLKVQHSDSGRELNRVGRNGSGWRAYWVPAMTVVKAGRS